MNNIDKDIKIIKILGVESFQFSAIHPEDLGATEYTPGNNGS
jgi:hypothetical protein